MTSTYSGQRSYPKSTIIYVDTDAPLISEKRVIAKVPGDNEATFKISRYQLIPDEKIEMTDGIIICGVVVGSFMPEMLRVGGIQTEKARNKHRLF
jgi:hypothetical protein